MFEEIQKGGMAAMMKFMNDPKWLAKVGEKLGDVPMPAGGTAMPPEAAPSAMPSSKTPDINNILDAAKYLPSSYAYQAQSACCKSQKQRSFALQSS